MANEEKVLIDFSGVVFRKDGQPILKAEYREFIDDFLDLLFDYEMHYSGIMEHISEQEERGRNFAMERINKGIQEW
jgi:hypothetical protein